jgi:hypothetical protein
MTGPVGHTGGVARLRFRDKFYSRQTARAITSPTTILVAGGAVALGLAASLPLALVAGVGAAAWAAKVAIAMPKGVDNDGIDPFSLAEPWRSYVWKAKRSKRQFFAAVKATRKGPLHDRLDDLADRIDTGVGEVNRIAQSGQALSTARAQIDIQAIRQELTQLNWAHGGPPQPGSSRAAAVAALESQLATAERLDQVIADTSDQLTLLDARLDEAVTRAVELSARGQRVDELGSIVSDVDTVVGDMESLRQALDETDDLSSNQLPAPGLGPALPSPSSPSSTSSTSRALPPSAPSPSPASSTSSPSPRAVPSPSPSPPRSPSPSPSPPRPSTSPSPDPSQQRPA